MGRWKRRLIVLSGGVALLIVAGSIAAFMVGRKNPDPRAYPSSDSDVSLDEALKRADIVVPNCLADRLRYALEDNGFGYYDSIYLKLLAPQACTQEFLDENSMVSPLQSRTIGGPADDTALNYRELWMSNAVVGRLGWDLGPDQKFQQFSAGKPTNYSVTVLLQHAGTAGDISAYVYAFHGG
jgi:hypothetical protein